MLMICSVAFRLNCSVHAGRLGNMFQIACSTAGVSSLQILRGMLSTLLGCDDSYVVTYKYHGSGSELGLQELIAGGVGNLAPGCMQQQPIKASQEA